MNSWGYISDENENPRIVVGPFVSLEEAKTAAEGRTLVAINTPRENRPRCHACGTFHDRLPMDSASGRVYDALFKVPNPVLEWDEDNDCGMAALMREVATVAAHAALQDPQS